ncbi:AMP-binding protein [Rhodococcus sp. 5G237]
MNQENSMSPEVDQSVAEMWGSTPRTDILSTFNEAVSAVPDRLFLDFNGDSYTYQRASARISELAGGLVELGVKPGQIVAGMLDNNAESVFGWLAANAVGAIYMGINTALKGEFLRHVLAESGAEVVLVEPDYVPRITRIHTELTTVRTLVYRGDEQVDTSPFQGVRLKDLEGLSAPPTADIDPDDISCLVATGGTTGPSKLCMISHSYLLNLSRLQNLAQGRRTEDIVWNPMPSYHLNLLCTTIVSSMLVQGTGYVAPRFSLSNFWPEMERSKATIANLLGAMIQLVAQAPDTEVSDRCIGQLRVVNGVPFPAEIQQIWRDRFKIQIAGSNAYGTTEASWVTFLPAGEYQKPGSSGRRHDDFDVRILDDQGREVPTGTAGEVVVRPLRPGVMFSGYWRRPTETLAVMKDLWWHTGDIGKFDEDGYFYFVDRKKDYLRRRGENISSYEVETAVLQHPLVSEVAAHAVLSDLTEDDLKLTIVLEDQATLDHLELFEWLTDRLPYFALPRYIEFRDELPKSGFGRVWKYKLREEGCTADTWDREVAGVSFERR